MFRKNTINVNLVLALIFIAKISSGQEYDDPGSMVCRRKHGFCMSQPSCCYSGEYKANICRKTARSVCCYTWNTCLAPGFQGVSQIQTQQQSQPNFNRLPLFQNPQHFLGLGGNAMPMQRQFAPQTDFRDNYQTKPRSINAQNRGLLNSIQRQRFYGALFSERN